MLWVTDAKYLGGYRLWLAFNDGASGEVDLTDRLYGEIFEPLKEVSRFSQVQFNPEMDTVVWPNGANLAPEYLYDKMVEQGCCVACQDRARQDKTNEDEVLHVTGARYVGDYRVWLRFNDDTCGEADLSAALSCSIAASIGSSRPAALRSSIPGRSRRLARPKWSRKVAVVA